MDLFVLVTTDLNYDQRMQRSCTALHEAGFNVTLIGRILPDSTPLNPNFPYHQNRLKCRFHKGPLFYLEYQLRLLMALIFKKADLILAVDLDTLPAAVFLGKAKRVPVVYDAHEYFTETPELVRRKIKQRIWEGLASICIPQVSLAYTVSNGLAQLLSQRYHQDFATIRNVPFKKEFQIRTNPPDKKIVLYQGALNEGRGLEVLLESVPSLPENIFFQLAGEGDLSGVLREKAKALKIEHRVQFLGWVPPDQLNALTLKAWVGYNLLEDRGLSYRYSLANKTFDYIQAGIPALHSHLPEYVQLLESYPVGIILNTLTTQEVIRVLTKLMHAPDEWMAMHFQCGLAAKDLTWENESALLIHNIRAVIPAKS